ncbi:hypothetical protein Clacol_009406 [Clathrus columnatus]|uniref:Coenzyme Q-binding protein COQ10 START domain-containing protein n=1 Tax=Clathrus columnatus TaxID=1419009 RepID=A0AAV5AQG2_9AGAM|nr:hypothetical protein Clacol_009406 [Clathrus columnatus]
MTSESNPHSRQQENKNLATLPDPLSSVTHVTCEATIDAPIDSIWKTILDFPSYTSWNPFVRSQILMDSNWKSPLENQHQTPTVGSNILMRVHNPPAVDMMDPSEVKTTSKLVLTFIDEEAKVVVWDQASYPSWFLKSRRWQSLTEIQLEDGKKIVKYFSVETFNGIGAWVIKWIYLERLKKAMNGVSEGLKNYLEKKPHQPEPEQT